MVGQLDVFRHYTYMLSVYIQEASEVIISGLLEHLDMVHSFRKPVLYHGPDAQNVTYG